MWNASPTVDQITWDSLPVEMRKVSHFLFELLNYLLNALQREINYSLIQVRPIPKLNDLFASVSDISKQRREDMLCEVEWRVDERSF